MIWTCLKPVDLGFLPGLIDEDEGTRMTRDEHLAWCKKRALEYVDRGELHNAVASMGSDLTKHEDAANPANDGLLMLGMMYVMDNDAAAVRRWIEGFR